METPQEEVPLRTVRSTHLYEEVARELEHYISANRMKPGDPLPAERDLCARLGTSRASLREALRILGIVGLVETRPGGRSVVGSYDISLLTSWVARSLQPATERSLRDLMDVREILEVRAVQLAAVTIRQEQLLQLESNLERTERRLERGEEVLDEDSEFHDIVMRAAGNIVLARFNDVVAGLLQDLRTKVLAGAGGGAGMLREHRRVYQALHDHDVELSTKAMQRHLAGANKVADLLLREGRLAESDGTTADFPISSAEPTT
jgi:GntR family transcriptional repressor for pyruvate dehydrogenase complex